LFDNLNNVELKTKNFRNTYLKNINNKNMQIVRKDDLNKQNNNENTLNLTKKYLLGREDYDTKYKNYYNSSSR
jgi:hypothetical protein